MAKLRIEKNHSSGWRKVGIMKSSHNSNVVLLSIFELPNYVWLVVDKKDLEDLLNGFRFQIDIKQKCRRGW